jgi:hypothetical protein
LARSVAELLPRSFDELTLDDVRAIIEAVGEERESLFFERKQQVRPAILAKSCAAFANTMGGLLLIGIADEDDEFVGIEGPIAEPQVWVKDVLRGHLLPLPPFRARWLSTDDDGARGVLLVLVEESTATPHLLTRHGAIYVRNPGSSDPVPIQDQRRMLDLVARGERAREYAAKRVIEVLSDHNFQPAVRPEVLALSPTGTGSGFTTPLFGQGADLGLLRRALGEHQDGPRDVRRPFWTQYSARVERYTRPHLYPIEPDRVEGIEVWRDGTLAMLRGRIPQPERGDDDDLREHDELLHEALIADVRRCLDVGLDVLLELGAHGETAVAFMLPAGRSVHWRGGGRKDLEQDVIVTRWTALDLDEEQRNSLTNEIVAEIGRALGFGPEGFDG